MVPDKNIGFQILDRLILKVFLVLSVFEEPRMHALWYVGSTTSLYGSGVFVSLCAYNVLFT